MKEILHFILYLILFCIVAFGGIYIVDTYLIDTITQDQQDNIINITKPSDMQIELPDIQIKQLYDTFDKVADLNITKVVLEHITQDDLYRSIDRYVLVKNTTTAGSIVFNGTLYLTVIAKDIESGEVYAKTEVKPIK